MRRFRKSRPQRPPLQRRVPRAWDRPEELPGIVPIDTLHLGRSERAAIAITGMWAYTNGFEILVTALIHPDGPGFDAETPNDPTLIIRPYRISVQLSDGRTITGERPRGDSGPTGPTGQDGPAGPIMRPRGGGGTSHYQHSRWWVWPLPPSGPLKFICEWPSLLTGETSATIDARLILDAARHSVRPWPQESGSPEH
jgi:hypothetical protein